MFLMPLPDRISHTVPLSFLVPICLSCTFASQGANLDEHTLVSNNGFYAIVIVTLSCSYLFLLSFM